MCHNKTLRITVSKSVHSENPLPGVAASQVVGASLLYFAAC